MDGFEERGTNDVLGWIIYEDLFKSWLEDCMGGRMLGRPVICQQILIVFCDGNSVIVKMGVICRRASPVLFCSLLWSKRFEYC